MLQISGIPRRKNEDIIELLKVVASKADCRIWREPVDVTHQTSRRETAPIIVKFVKKNYRMNFYHQRKKVHNLEANQIVSGIGCTEEDEEVTINNICINESLTMYNRSLLKERRKKWRELNYQFTGYTVNRQVRATKSGEDEFIITESIHHVSNLS